MLVMGTEAALCSEEILRGKAREDFSAVVAPHSFDSSTSFDKETLSTLEFRTSVAAGEVDRDNLTELVSDKRRDERRRRRDADGDL